MLPFFFFLFLLHSQFKLQAFSFVLVMLSLIPFRTWRSFLRSLCRFQKIEWYIYSTKYKYISICICIKLFKNSNKFLFIARFPSSGHYFVYWLVYEFHHFLLVVYHHPKGSPPILILPPPKFTISLKRYHLPIIMAFRVFWLLNFQEIAFFIYVGLRVKHHVFCI